MSNAEFVNPELAAVRSIEDSGDLSRSEVILKGALAAGAVYGTFMVGPFVRKALAMSGSSDVDILNFALTLEYLESTFYEEAKTRAKASGELKSLIEPAGRRREAARRSADGDDQETRRQARGGAEIRLPLQRTPPASSSSPRRSRTPGSAPTTAPAPMIKSKEVLGAAGSIVQVEARHAAAIRLQNKEEPAPEAFDPSLEEAQVLKAVEPFIA